MQAQEPDASTAMPSEAFDMFRLNCMLHDADGSHFNAAVVSLVAEFIFKKRNEPCLLSDCYDYIRSLSIKVERPTLRRIVERAKILNVEAVDDDMLITVDSEAYEQLTTTSSNTIENYIDKFIKTYALDAEKAGILLDIIHTQVYENIADLAKGEIKHMMVEKARERFPSDDLLIFNKFLDEEDRQKDEALYKLFYRAFQFALATSGKAAKGISVGIFKNKTYIIDTNILFGLLGIDGHNEQTRLEELLDACIHQGVTLAYTLKTYVELGKRRDQAVMALSRFGDGGINAKLAEETIINGNLTIKEGFANHYYNFKRVYALANPEIYRQKLMTNFNTIVKKYRIEELRNDSSITEREVETYGKELKIRKRELGVRNYTGVASQVDAYNLMLVKSLRNVNAFNFSDVQCFYLSTDTSLSKILSEDGDEAINEVLQPTQAFLLHMPMTGGGKEPDYVAFSKFLKKHVPGNEYSGVQIIRYVSLVSSLTSDPKVIAENLKNYANLRYNSIRNYDSEVQIPTFAEFAQSALDEQIASLERERQDAIDKVELTSTERGQAIAELQCERNSINYTIQTSVNEHLRSSLTQTRIIEGILLFVLTTGGALSKLFIKKELSPVIVIILTAGPPLIAKGIEFYASNRFPVMANIWKIIFIGKIKRSEFYRLGSYSSRYLELAHSSYVRAFNKNIWSAEVK